MAPPQAARYLGVKERTIYLWAQQEKLPAFKVGSVWRFRRSELDRWLESTRSGPPVNDIEPLTPYVKPWKSKWRLRKDEEQVEQALIDACKPHRHMKEFPARTLLRRDVYDQVAARWQELGLPGEPPELPAFDEDQD